MRGDWIPKALLKVEMRPQKSSVDAAARRVLRRIARLKRAATADSATTTEWEADFLQDVGQRLETFGRAFVDPEKGDTSRPVSIRQSIKLREIQRSLKRQKRESEPD